MLSEQMVSGMPGEFRVDVVGRPVADAVQLCFL